MSLVKTNKKGFTLIELVIVLAIAALILAGILLAVSGAQKSRRDAQRKNDAGRILANGETYASNHGGALYTTTVSLLDVGMKDPLSGSVYDTITAGNPGYTTITIGAAGVKQCDNATAMTSPRNFRVDMLLESGDTACVDNH